MTLVALAGYIAVQLAIGAYVSRRILTETDYLIAGRKLGYGLGTFTIFATWFGAETCIGSAGAIYAQGLAGGRADPFGYGLCIVLMGAFLARRLWARGLTTLADLYRQRYGRLAERLAVLLMLPASVLWAAAQIRAFGGVLAATSGLDVPVAVTIAVAIVILYTAWGGLLADAYTDLLEGAVLVAGLAVLFVAVWRNGGSEALAAVPAARLQPFQGAPMTLLENWAIPICGSVVAAELVSRVLACRSADVAQRSALAASGMYFAAGAMPALLGLMAFGMGVQLTDPEALLPTLAAQHLGPILYTVFVGALVTAILSVADSTLLTSAALVSHNIVVPLAPGLSERGKVRVARGCVVALGLVAYGLAFTSESVYGLVLEASAFGSAGLFACVTLGLFTRWGGSRAALGALGAGLVSWVLGAYVLDLPYPYLTSLACAFGAFAIGAGVDARRPQVLAVAA